MARRTLTVEWASSSADPIIALQVADDNGVSVLLGLRISATTGAQYEKFVEHSVHGQIDPLAAQTAFDTGGQEALFQWMEARLGD